MAFSRVIRTREQKKKHLMTHPAICGLARRGKAGLAQLASITTYSVGNLDTERQEAPSEVWEVPRADGEFVRNEY
jgi:hypothetical protein